MADLSMVPWPDCFCALCLRYQWDEQFRKDVQADKEARMRKTHEAILEIWRREDKERNTHDH